MVGNLQQKYDDIDNLLVDCIKNYHEPNKFFTYSGAVIQACRNLTFALQANKHNITDFATWYEPWRINMKNDLHMKWIHDKRNEVVKQDVLGSESYASLVTISDYRRIKVEEYFDYKTSTSELMQSANKMVARHPALAHSTIAIERKYVVSIGDQAIELVRLLYYALHYLGLMLGDLEVYLENHFIDKIPDDLSTLIESNLSEYDEYRFLTFKARDGSRITTTSLRIERDEEAVKQAKKRYGDLKKLTNETEIRDAAKILFENAKSMLRKDGMYLPSIFMRTPQGYQPMYVAFQDRAEKLKFSYDLPGILEAHYADGIIFISETWVLEPKRLLKRLNEGKEVQGAHKKKESLWLSLLTRSGETLDIITEIRRDEKGIILGNNKSSTPDPESLNFFHPVHLLWKSSYR